MGDALKALVKPVLMPLVFFIALGVIYLIFSQTGINPEPVISITALLSPLWLPYVLFFLMYDQWGEYVVLKWRLKNPRITLRIKLPQEVFKSPEAMESIISQVYSSGAGENLWETYIDGLRPYFISFELVSHGGEVRFYINVPGRKVKNSVEALLYAQYPGVEVIEELLDYTSEITWNPKKYEMLAFHIVKKDDDIFPIKTYIEFGLDKMPKEEEKFEPMASMIEQLGRAKPHERVWLQILARGHGKKGLKTGQLKEEGTWEKRVEEKITEMLGRGKKGEDEDGTQPRLTRGEQDTIAAMERNVSKYAFEVAIRMMIISPKEQFSTEMITPVLRTLSQYDVVKRQRIGVTWRSNFDYNWFSDFSGKKRMQYKKDELADYKRRVYNNRAGDGDAPKVMSAEEIATIYHLPGSSVVSPSLARVLSTRKEAPSNLPTGMATRL